MLSYTFLISMPGGSEWILILLIVLPLYFLPTIISTSRKNPNTVGIFALNLLLGWTFLGWIGALIWALSSKSIQNPTVIVNNTSQSYSQEYKGEPQDTRLKIPPKGNIITKTTHQDKIDQLRQLKQLLDNGILTTEEFNKQKADILG